MAHPGPGAQAATRVHGGRKRSRRASPIRPTSDQPPRSPTTRIDQRHGPPAQGSIWSIDPGLCRVRSNRERGAQGRTLMIEGRVCLIRSERRDDDPDASRAPDQIAGRCPGGSLVPADLALERPDVVDRRLDFDDEHRPGHGIEGEQVDPTVPSAVDRILDLASNDPPRRTQATIDIGRAPGMDLVADRSGDLRRSSRKLRVDAEASQDPVDRPKVRGAAPALDHRDERPRHAGLASKPALAPPKAAAVRAADVCEGHAEDRHGRMEARRPSLAVDTGCTDAYRTSGGASGGTWGGAWGADGSRPAGRVAPVSHPVTDLERTSTIPTQDVPISVVWATRPCSFVEKRSQVVTVVRAACELPAVRGSGGPGLRRPHQAADPRG